MKKLLNKSIIDHLQRQILDLEGFKSQTEYTQNKLGIPLENHFSNRAFPTGTIHEFLSEWPEATACTSAFICALLSKIDPEKGIYVWIGKQHKLFPPSLKGFGIQPHQVIFINLVKQKDILWATEEALKCKSLSAVISELDDLTFIQSQRLQLTVEKSKVTGFILRTQTATINPTACTARWQITAAASENTDNMPGVGFPKWQVNLLKVRNGSTANILVTWKKGHFVTTEPATSYPFTRKLGAL